MAQKILVQSMSWTNTKDKYEEGEVGDSRGVLFEKDLGMFDTVADLVEEMSSRFGLSENMNDWAIYGEETHGDEGRIDVQMLVNEDNNEPSEREVAEWKAGKRTLWNAYIVIRFHLVTIGRVDADAFAEKFGIQVV